MLECGITYVNPNLKIVGGSMAAANSWPSMAYIIFSYRKNVYLTDLATYYTVSKSYLCGGNL